MKYVVDPDITEAWILVYDSLRRYWLRHNRSPSYIDLCQDVGCSVSTVRNAYRELGNKGYIHRQKHEARSGKPVDPDLRIVRREPDNRDAPAGPAPWDDLDIDEDWET